MEVGPSKEAKFSSLHVHTERHSLLSGSAPAMACPTPCVCSPNFTVAGSTKWNVLLQLKVCARHKRRHACAVHEPAHTRASMHCAVYHQEKHANIELAMLCAWHGLICGGDRTRMGLAFDIANLRMPAGGCGRPDQPPRCLFGFIAHGGGEPGVPYQRGV